MSKLRSEILQRILQETSFIVSTSSRRPLNDLQDDET
jgi:hypothetical protein